MPSYLLDAPNVLKTTEGILAIWYAAMGVDLRI